MQKFVHAVIFNKDKNKVLICHHQKLKKLHFIGGKLEDESDPIGEAYREIREETGITRDDIELFPVVEESIKQYYPVSEVCDEYDSSYSINVYTGILNKDVELIEEKNPLEWMHLSGVGMSIYTFKFQNPGLPLHYLIGSMEVLKLNGYPAILDRFKLVNYL